MVKTKGKALAATQWEANCLFCGDGLRDEGEGFLDHIQGKLACHDAHDAWVENLGRDWLGGG